MRVVWSRRATRNLMSLRDFIARDPEQSAVVIAERILGAIDLLATQPEMGRAPGTRELVVPGTRELVVPGTRYIIPYRVRFERLELIAVFHGQQKWPGKLS